MKRLPTLYRKTNQTDFQLRNGSGYDTFEDCKEEMRNIRNDNGEFLIRDRFELSFHNIIPMLEVCSTPFINLKGFNYNIDRLIIKDNKCITSLEGIQTSKLNDLHLNNCVNLASFHNIHKHLNSTGVKEIFIYSSFTNITNLLGLMLIKSLIEIHVNFSSNCNLNYKNAIGYINHSISVGGDIMDCREELIANGLKEYARL